MEKIFGLYLSSSISGAVMILLLYLAEKVWKPRLSKAWQYYIWLLVVLRLLIPFSPVPGFIGNVAYPGTDHNTWGISLSNPMTIENNMEAPAKETALRKEHLSEPDEAPKPNFPSERAASNPLIYFYSIGWLLWILPAILLFIYKMFCYQNCLRKLQSMRIPVTDNGLLKVCSEAAQELKIKEKVNVYYCKAAVSPMVAGIIRPCILLPDNQFSLSEQYYVFRHELIHLKRKDILYKWLVELSVCLHWFNPLVYVMRLQCEKNCELACDEAVLFRLMPENKIAYGDTLISSLKSSKSRAGKLASVPLCENTKHIKERLESIMKAKKSTPAQKIISICLTIALTSFMLSLGGLVTRADQAAKDKTETAGVTDPWLNDSSNPESKKWNHSFRMSGFFQNKYGIKMAWNNDPSLYKTTCQISAEEEYTVSFTEETAVYADNPQILEAVRLSILEQRENEKNSPSEPNNSWSKNSVMVNPVVVAVEGPYEETYDRLAMKFYEEDNLNFYYSVLKKASTETQKTIVERSYTEDNKPMFSLSAELLTDSQQESYLKRSYENHKIAYFSILSGEVNPELIKAYASQSYEDGRVEFFSITKESLSEKEQKDFAYRSYEDKRIEFFAVSMEALNSRERNELAKKAKEEGRIEFYYLLAS